MFYSKIIFLSLLLLLSSNPVFASAPEMTLKDLSGKEHKLAEFVGNGKWTIVVLWAEDCHVCNAEIETLDFFHEDHQKKDARILGVSIDGWDKVELSRDFVKRHGLSFQNMIIEPDMKDISQFGGNPFIGTPTFYFYTPEGEIVISETGMVPVEIIEEFIKNYEKQ